MELNNLRMRACVTADDGQRYIISTVLLVDGSGYETIIFRVGDDNKIDNKAVVRRCGYATVVKASFGHRAVSLSLQSGIRPEDIKLDFVTEEGQMPMAALEPSAETCAIVEEEIKKIVNTVSPSRVVAHELCYKIGDRVVARLFGRGRERVGTVGYVSPPNGNGRIYYNVACDDGASLACLGEWLRHYTPDKPN
jgi:hypothetical protein